jgi:hypothetical protein
MDPEIWLPLLGFCIVAFGVKFLRDLYLRRALRRSTRKWQESHWRAISEINRKKACLLAKRRRKARARAKESQKEERKR